MYHGLNDFIENFSFWITWIGSFGIWKEDFDKLNDFSRYTKLQLAQADVMCRLLSDNNRKAFVQCGHFAEVSNPKNKGGYNMAQVFGCNYLKILNEFVKDGSLSNKVFNKEKKAVLTKHINFYYFDHRREYNYNKTGYFKYLMLSMAFSAQLQNYNKTGYFKYLMPDYKFKPYFYIYYLKEYIFMLILKVKPFYLIYYKAVNFARKMKKIEAIL